MKPIYAHTAAALALTFAIAACVPPAPRPTPPVQTRPTPTPSPTPAPPAPTFSNWMDAPQTPGDWTYRSASGGGTAQFGAAASEPRFTMRCDIQSRSVILTRLGAPGSATQMIVRAESQSRTLPAASDGGSVTARLAASDRLLDAMALSKGRFAIEVAGASPLYLPSWAEVTRVIEDCR